jgi:hypothetical protein
MEGGIQIYRSKDDKVQIDVHLVHETIWLNRQQLGLLFDRDIKTIGKHNALLDFMDKENILNTNRELIGGVLIPDDNGGVPGFRYPLFRISDTNDLTRWEFFNATKLNS